MKILLVGGTFDKSGGRQSGVVNKINESLIQSQHNVVCKNGGQYDTLNELLQRTVNYDAVFWFANVPNELPKIRNVKEIAPHTLLVNSKRNDSNKYTTEDLLQRMLGVKANLCFEFSKADDGKFNIRVLDPLGCLWYEGTDISVAVKATIQRLEFLKSVTRRSTTQDGSQLDIKFDKEDNRFLEIVKNYAEKFHQIMYLPSNVTRFVGNCSLRFKHETRCMNGFPAIRKDNMILMSRRNVDKTGISKKDFVPVFEEDGLLKFRGQHKPSVDTPVQIELFKALPNVDYIIHGHCYVDGAVITKVAVPCGAVEEVGHVLAAIDEAYESREKMRYLINLNGHGCLIMFNKKHLDDINDISFVTRPMPEAML